MGGGGDNSAMVDLMQKGMMCNAKAQPTCNGECEWKADENKCDLNGMVAMQLMMGGGDNSAMSELMQKGMPCSAKTQPTCDGDCEWKADENKCDLSGMVAMQLMMGVGDNSTLADLMHKGITCNAKTQPTCDGDCEWKADESKCDLNGIVAMQLMMGGGDNSAMAELMQKGMTCSAKTQPTCDRDCEWKADENKCDLNGMVAMQLMMGGGENSVMAEMMQMAMACSAKTQPTCNGDCGWIADENKCDVHPQLAFDKFCRDAGALSGATRAFASMAVLA